MRRATSLSDFADLLTGALTAVLVTIGPDGAPAATPVWFLYDGRAMHVSTVAERQKHRNVIRDPRVSLAIVDPVDPMRYVELRGEATLADDPSYGVRDAIVRKHGFADGAAFDAPGTVRVVISLEPTRVLGRTG